MQTDRRSVERPKVVLPVITRESVRDLIEKEATYLRAAVAAGRNHYQIRLDQHDQIVAFMGTLNPVDLEHFSSLYETEAAAARAAAAQHDGWRPPSGAVALQAGHSGDIRVGPWAIAAAGVVAAMAAVILKR